MSRLDSLYQKAVDFEDNNLESELSQEEKQYLEDEFKQLISKDYLTEDEVESLETIVSIFIMYELFDSIMSQDIHCSDFSKRIINHFKFN